MFIGGHYEETTLPSVELSHQEHFIIQVVRKFDFLRRFGYDIKSVLIYFYDIGVTFENRRAKREISVNWYLHDEQFDIHFYNTGGFSLRRIFIRDLYSYFHSEHLDVKVTVDNYCEIVEKSADFVKKHLMSIIRGEQWIKSLSRGIK